MVHTVQIISQLGILSQVTDLISPILFYYISFSSIDIEIFSEYLETLYAKTQYVVHLMSNALAARMIKS